ncbi:MAG: DUF4215 domain-containing protein, partial [Polyangiaceae bacterium]|nr:DUF4215 domain-containing protein [Polyangiaceae bacterium]
MSARAAFLMGALAVAVAACGDDGALFTGGTTSSSTSQGGGGSSSTSQGGGGSSTTSSGGGAGGAPNPLCGDGNVDYQAGEQCDDGNTTSGDGCSASCAIEPAPTCGNGVLDLASGEECDDGNTTAGDGCSPACQLEPVGQSCGNSQIEAPEVCDDGNTQNGDGCNPTCNLHGTTSLFAGAPGQAGSLDGIGQAARFGGTGVLAINATHLFVGDEANHTVRRVEIATALVQTIAGDAVNGSAGYIDNPTGLNARFGSVEALGTDGATVWIADAA